MAHVINEHCRAVYEKYRKEGYEAADIRNFFENNNPNQHRSKVLVKTPYFCDDQPVVGLVVVDTDARHRDSETTMNIPLKSEVYVKTGEKTYVPIRKYGEYKTLRDDSWFYDATPWQIKKECEETAAAATRYCHVAMYDEYMPSLYAFNGSIGSPKPTDADYGEYLERVVNEVEQTPDRFLGKIRTPEQMHIAYESWPAWVRQQKKAAKAAKRVNFDIGSQAGYEQSSANSGFEI